MKIPAINYYKSVPDELQATAFACEAWLKAGGYSVRREANDIEHPALATITCKRPNETLYVLVRSKVDVDELNLWIRYGKSCTRATFVTICIPSNTKLSAALIARVTALQGGLLVVSPDRSVHQAINGGDLSFNMALPDLKNVRAPIKKLIAPIHRLFESGDWRRGFEEACKLVEKSARDYMLRIQKLGRAEVINGSNVRILTVSEIKKLPLGALADAFCRMKAQNPTESFLCSALKRINPERIATAHRTGGSRAYERLKKTVGRHMWLIHNILEQTVA